jgi:hypothetical protein
LVTRVTHVENYTATHSDAPPSWYNVCMVTMFDTVANGRLHR